MRLFIGTLLNDGNQAFYEQFAAKLVSVSPVVRRIPAASAHITYSFLGEVSDALVHQVADAVEGAASRFTPVPIVLGAPRVLYAGREPRLVCADVTAGDAAVRSVAGAILEQLRATCPSVAASGMKAPHVTLARFKRGVRRADGEAVTALLAAGRLAVGTREDLIEGVQVVSSQLTGGGAVYRVLASLPLGGSARWGGSQSGFNSGSS